MSRILFQKLRSFQIFKTGKLYQKSRKITVNFSTRIIGNIVSRVLGIVTIPIIARALGPESYGEYNLVIVILSYTVMVINFGFTVYGVRGTAQKHDSSNLVNQILTARLTLGLISIVISSFVILILYRQNLKFVLLVYLGYILVAAQIFNIDYYFFGKGNMLIPILAQISGRVLFTIGVIAFIKKPRHLALLVLLYSLYYLVSSGIGLLIYLRKNKISITISLRKAVQTLKKTFLLGISAQMEMFQISFPLIIISWLSGSYALGIFSAAFKSFSIVLLVFQAVMLALAPYLVKIGKLSKEYQYKYIYFLLSGMIIIGLIGAIFLYLTGEFVVNILFGKSFGDALPVYKLICFILIPLTPINMVLGSLLIYMNQEKKYIYSTTAMAIITLVSTPLLVNLFLLRGAVIAISLSTFTSIAVSTYHINRVFPGLFLKKSKKI